MTRSDGLASPRHDSNNWIARCATWPFAVAGFHSKSSGMRWNSSQSSAVAILCLEMKTSCFGCRRSAKWSRATRISVRMSATRSGSNTSGSPDRRKASSVRICTGVRFGASAASLTEPTVPLAGCAVSCRSPG